MPAVFVTSRIGRSLALLAALAISGCVAPAVVSSVDPEICKVIAPAIARSLNRQTPAAQQPQPSEEHSNGTAEPAPFAPGPSGVVPILHVGEAANPAKAIEAAHAVGPGDRPAGLRAGQADQLPPRVALRQVPAPPPTGTPGQLSTVQRIKPLSEISLNIMPPTLHGDDQRPMPPPLDYAVEDLPRLAAERPFTRGAAAEAGYVFHPAPTGLEFCYQPLMFEEVNAERYGHSFGVLQPVASMTAFYGRIPLIPYMTFARPARRCTYHAHWTLRATRFRAGNGSSRFSAPREALPRSRRCTGLCC